MCAIFCCALRCCKLKEEERESEREREGGFVLAVAFSVTSLCGRVCGVACIKF